MFSATDGEVTDLTTLSAVRTQLKISGTGEDEYLQEQIKNVSAIICTYLNIATATDGSRTLARQTITETFRKEGHGKLLLSRYPATSITSVVEDGVTLDPSNYELDGSTGTLQRLNDDEPWVWSCRKIVVTYVAGYVMPGEDDRTLPKDIEDAAIGLIKTARSARTRDPSVKGEEIPGVLRTDYWVGSVGDVGHIPPDIASKLDQYRNVTF